MSDVPFEAAAREFLALHAVDYNHPATLRSLFSVFGKAFDGKLLREIDAHTLQAFVASRFEAGASRPTLNRYRSGLRVLFAWAIRRGYYSGPNPADALKRHREGPGETRYLSPAEYDRLMMAAAPHLKPIIATACFTGGRLSEILALRWRDVDLDAGVLTFRRETTKGRRTRHIPIVPEFRAVLLAIRRGRPDQHVFTYNERPIKRVKRAYARACRKAEIDDAPLACCRHTFATWYMQRGGKIRRLQHYLGHRSIKTTERYEHSGPDFMEDAMLIGPPRIRKQESSDPP